jgi:hypothetical protein
LRIGFGTDFYCEEEFIINVLFYCTSLGLAPALNNVQKNCPVDRTYPIDFVWNDAVAIAKENKGIKNLLIACHGVFEGITGSKELVPGFGISLGTGITSKNVSLTKKLQRQVSNIYIFACGGASEPSKLDQLEGGTQSPHPSIVPNNRFICSQMSDYTEANVFASVDYQEFERNKGGIFTAPSFNFGKWEGKVEKFIPGKPPVDVTNRMHLFGNETGDE